MERMNFVKRFLCMVLALALMLGTMPAHALGAHAHNSTVNFTQVDENGNVVVNFTQVDNDRVTAGMTPNALLSAVNFLFGRAEFLALAEEKLNKTENETTGETL